MSEEIIDRFRIDSVMEQPKWLEYFKITPEQFAQAQTRAESDDRTALDLLIEEGKLNEQKYLAFEQKETKVSFLQAKFFNSNPPIHLWKNLTFKDCRKAMCLPIAEWDGHIIWGKLTTEPTPFDQMVPNSVFVLAPCSGLLNYFGKWKEAFNLEAPVEAKTESSEALEVLEVPAGLTVDFKKPIALEPLSDATESPVASEGATETDAPAGLSLSAPAAAKVISFDVPANLVTSSTAPEKSAVATKGFALGKPVQMPDLPPPPPVDEVSEVKPPLPFKAKIEGAPAQASSLNLSSVDNQDKWADVLLGEWLKHFDKAVILIREKNGLIVWRWAGPVSSSIKNNEIFPLDTPSVFKIVNDTGQPYHGTVSTSSVNDQAFKTLTGGQYPEHITIVPISVHNQVVVQIVGLSTRAKGVKLQLSTLTDLGKAFSQKFIELSKVLKAS